MIKNVCVYCSSSNFLEERYYEEARVLGRLIAASDLGLIYGGGNIGLMGVLAREVHEHGGYVVGVIPHALKNREGVAYELADEMVITHSMRERKAIMIEKADAFIVLPGGIGTLEEMMETMTLKHLGYHRDPMVIINTNGFYDALLGLLAQFNEQKFLSDSYQELFHVVQDAPSAIELLRSLRQVDSE